MATHGESAVGASVNAENDWARRLPWDSQRFGFEVWRIERAILGNDELAAAVAWAYDQGARLVYWQAAGERPLSPELLGVLGGRLVDDKTTFRADYGADVAVPVVVPLAASGSEQRADRFQLRELTSVDWSPPLERMALAAGEYSRLRVDPRLPPGLFEDVYRQWLINSLSREVADTVLGLVDERDQPGGFLTLSLRAACGSIGLLAVDEPWRGRGLGRRLLAAARVWLQSRQGKACEVVTQRANQRACRFYVANDFRQAAVDSYYHFWRPARKAASCSAH